MFGLYKSLAPQQADGLADGSTCDSMRVHELLLTWQARTRGKFAALDCRAKTIGDLFEDRTVARWIDGNNHARHLHSSRRRPAYSARVTPLPEPAPKHSVSVAAAILDAHGRFLAIRRSDNGRWEPPGGVLELEESIEQGLIREVAEETGFSVEPVTLTGVYKNMERGIVALVFRCSIVGRTTQASDEVDEVRWLTRAELTSMSEAYRIRLLDALDDSSPRVRAHDGAQLLTQPR